ncbi:hypothetical protein OPT61_g4045 [Boeremia exigua]|uniref:Uncharacterized protein n=1 Tax=Boeremia exigua TaxID=749465 RepID=A0ACC2IFH5_9PLEO|nr:hypothetical protein OPT61_g4045 [Boeremia exigua]
MSRNIIITAATSTIMGHPTTPAEAAPAYNDLMFNNHEHPTNSNPPSGSNSGYATVPQNDDIELGHSQSAPFDPSVPHHHCETCDNLTTAREVRANERHCCLWVSIVIMTMSVAALLLGIVAVGAKYKH